MRMKLLVLANMSSTLTWVSSITSRQAFTVLPSLVQLISELFRFLRKGDEDKYENYEFVVGVKGREIDEKEIMNEKKSGEIVFRNHCHDSEVPIVQLVSSQTGFDGREHPEEAQGCPVMGNK